MDYRKALRRNLVRYLEERGETSGTLKAFYLAGSKKGKRVTDRTIQYMLDDRPDSPSPSLDTIAAVAVALKLQPWQLLAPEHPAGARLELATEQEIEARISRGIVDRMQALQGHLTALLRDNGTDGRSRALDDGVDSETPVTGKTRITD